MDQRKLLLCVQREVRKEAGLRQVDLAHVLKRPHSFVSKYKSGELLKGVAAMNTASHTPAGFESCRVH